MNMSFFPPDVGGIYKTTFRGSPEVPRWCCLKMPPIPPQRLRVLMLREQLQVAAHEHDVALLALIRERERQQGRRRRRRWVRPWIERRRLFGQYETLFQELERESRGDYVGYIQVDPKLFAELLLPVTPRITKGPRCVSP